MKKNFVNAAVFAAILISGAGMASAQSQSSSYSYQVRGESAYANAWSEDACSFAMLDIGGSDQVVHTRGGAPVQDRGVWVGLWSYNWCKGVEYYGDAFVSDNTFDVSMNGAAASVELEVYWYSWDLDEDGNWSQYQGGTSTATIKVAWTGVGETYRGMEGHTSRWGRNFSRYRWQGMSRDADVFVDATLDGVPLTMGPAFGGLGSYNSGSTEIYLGF